MNYLQVFKLLLLKINYFIYIMYLSILISSFLNLIFNFNDKIITSSEFDHFAIH